MSIDVEKRISYVPIMAMRVHIHSCLLEPTFSSLSILGFEGMEMGNSIKVAQHKC